MCCVNILLLNTFVNTIPLRYIVLIQKRERKKHAGQRRQFKCIAMFFFIRQQFYDLIELILKSTPIYRIESGRWNFWCKKKLYVFFMLFKYCCMHGNIPVMIVNLYDTINPLYVSLNRTGFFYLYSFELFTKRCKIVQLTHTHTDKLYSFRHNINRVN